MTDTTFDRVTNVLARNFGVDAATVNAETTFEELDFDSLVMVEFALALQKEFQVDVAAHDLADCVTVVDAVAFLKTKFVAV